MPCSNSIYLVCCYDPTRSFSACTPTIDGVPNSSFVDGNFYLGSDPVNGNICYSATSTPVGTVYNLQQSSYISQVDCDACQLAHGSGCPVIVTFTNAVLVNCCDPTDTLNASVPNTYSVGIQAIRYDDKCWTVQSFSGVGGVQLYGGYDGCVNCLSEYPCCGCYEIEVGVLFPIVVDDGNVFIDYTNCSGNLQTATATTGNLTFNICSQSGETITTRFDVGGSPYIGNTYPYEPFGGPNPDLTVYVTDLEEVCSGEPCGPMPSATPTPTPTVTPTPTITVTPTITPTPTSSPPFLPSPLNYTLSITGTCTSPSGAICVVPSGGVPPYTVEWLTPNLGFGLCKTGLTAGNYSIKLTDSSSPINQTNYISAVVGSSLSLGISSVNDTTCGLDDGEVVVYGVSSNLDITYYLYSGSSILNTITTTNGIGSFNQLASGNYYVYGVGVDGCTATTANFVVDPSDPLDFGFYIVNDTQCLSPSGKLYVTGLTGTAPYTYLWNTLETTSSITGLSYGSYSVTVTDNQGCTVSKSALVDYVPSLGLGSWTSTEPTCFNSDGSLTLTITGGTGPYFYSGSNGTTIVTYATSYTFTNLPAGPFFVDVTDAALCKQTFSATLLTPTAFYNVVANVTNSTCSSQNGSINVSLQGGSPPYTYSLSSATSTTSATTNSTQYIFSNLSNGNYNLTITDGGECEYNSTLVVNSTNLFSVAVSASTASCGLSNGSITLTATTGGVSPYTYTLDNGQTITTTSLLATFSSLPSGPYQYYVTDAGGCTVSGNTSIADLSALSFSLFPTQPTYPSTTGNISVLISQGQPPFTFTWSPNIPSNPQSVYVTGLTADTYTLTIVDDNGCVQTRSTVIEEPGFQQTFQTYTMCESDFVFTSATRRTMLDMVYDGFLDLTEPETGCTLSSMTFTIEVEVSGNTYSNSFYTGYTLTDIPTDTEYFTAVEDLLTGITGVSQVIIDPVTSQVSIFTEGELANTPVVIDLIIDYVILCPAPCPSPTLTVTPTITTTPTVTPTITETPTQTPTVTSSSTTQTPTPTNTLTPTNTPTSTITQTPTTTPTQTPSVTPTLTPTVTNTSSQTPTPTVTPSNPIQFLEGSSCYGNKMSIHPNSNTVCATVQGNVGFVNYYMSNCDYQNDFVNGNPTGCLVYQNDGVTLVGNGFLSDGCRFWSIIGGVVQVGYPQNCPDADICCGTTPT